MTVVAQFGEPWRTFLGPAEFKALLAGHGFAAHRDVGQREAVPGRVVGAH